MKGLENAIEYYSFQKNQLLQKVNVSNTNTVEEIIEIGKELLVLENKLTALEAAKEEV